MEDNSRYYQRVALEGYLRGTDTTVEQAEEALGFSHSTLTENWLDKLVELDDATEEDGVYSWKTVEDEAEEIVETMEVAVDDDE